MLGSGNRSLKEAIIKTLSITESIERARFPEDLFGNEGPDVSVSVYREYRRLARVAHPDAGGSDELMAKVNLLYADAQEAIKDGHYGERRVKVTALVIRTKSALYEVGEQIAHGDVANLYKVICDGLPAEAISVLKVARDHKDNELIRAEANSLRALRSQETADEKYFPYLAELLDQVSYREKESGIERRANVLPLLSGWYNLAEVTSLHDPLDPRDMSWMFRRLLTVLGYVHRQGIIHGSVIPEHVMIHPEMHGLMLIDWCYSVRDGGIIKAVPSAYKSWYPPEVLSKTQAKAGTDIFMAAQTMSWLLSATDIPRPMRAFFKGCMLPLSMRPNDAWKVLVQFDDLLEMMYGPRKFRPFYLKSKEI